MNKNVYKLFEKYDIDGPYDKYSEPGYNTYRPGGILLGDWNHSHVPKKVGDVLDQEYELEWFDEWVSCFSCGGLVRTSPDSCGWQPSYVESCGDILCVECIDWDELLDVTYTGDDSYIDNPRKALTVPLYRAIGDSGLIERGWERYNDRSYESGWFPGQNDDPKNIFAAIKDEYPGAYVLFVMSGQGQFDIDFDAWYKLPDTGRKVDISIDDFTWQDQLDIMGAGDE